MKKIIFFIASILDKLIPKTNIIIFNSFPDYSDNSYALFRYMLKNNLEKKYELIWLINYNNTKEIENKIKKEFHKNIKCYKKKSYYGLYIYFQANKVFSTHGIFSSLKGKKEKKINLWHGMPLKGIGFLDKKYHKSGKEHEQDYLIATSIFFQEIMGKSFGEKKEKVLLTGQPRTDLFFEKSEFYLKKNLKVENYNKVFIWLPTYRKSVIGKIRSDGEHRDLFSLKGFNEINEILKKKQYLLILKIHPMDELNLIKIENFTNIIIIKSKELENIDEQLYPLLGTTDALITDYSSVWIDYEILNKPIFFVIHDYEEYKNTRGLLFEDFINISPYPVIDTYKKFTEFLENYENINMNNREFTNKYNKYKDNKSCERIVKYLELDKK